MKDYEAIRSVFAQRLPLGTGTTADGILQACTKADREHLLPSIRQIIPHRSMTLNNVAQRCQAGEPLAPRIAAVRGGAAHIRQTL